MSTLEGLKNVLAAARKERIGMVDITVDELAKLLALVDAARVVDNSVYITPNTEKGVNEWGGLSRALAALEGE